MKVLIMTPVGRTEDGQQIDYFPSRWSAGSGPYKVNSFYPYNLAYLSRLLKARTDHAVRLVDANYYGVDSDEYVDIVRTVAPELLVVEIDSIVFEKQMAILRRCRQELPGLVVVACGPHPTARPQDTLAKGADFVALGEFEESICRLLESGLDAATPGIHPNPRGPLVDVKTLPWPEDEDIRRRDYCRLYGSEYNEVEMWTTRGCPAMCNFCVVTHVYYARPNYRVRDPADVIAEIRHLQRTIPGLQGIFFNEEAHTISPAFLTALCEAFLREGLPDELKFNCMANYDTLSPELLALMKRAGYYKIRIGIESLDEENMRLLSSTKMKSASTKLMSVLQSCRDLGIKVYSTLSVGTYGSTLDKDLRTLDQVWELHRQNLLQEFSLSINTPMLGTPFYDLCVANGWLVAGSQDYDGTRGAMINLPGYPAEEINRAFAHGTEIRNRINQANVAAGIHYSSYDRDWCAPVYATTGRTPGSGIL